MTSLLHWERVAQFHMWTSKKKLHALQKMVVLKCYMKQIVPKNTKVALELCVNVVLPGMLRSARQMRMMRALIRFAHCLQSDDVALAYELVVSEFRHDYARNYTTPLSSTSYLCPNKTDTLFTVKEMEKKKL